MSIFDEVTDRRNTNSLKYDFAAERGKPEGVLPLWVADMDFPAPQPVLDALHAAVSHGIFGYTEVKSDYFQVIARWFQKAFNWNPSEEWLVKTPGVVFAISAAVRGLTEEGDTVLIQPPVYYPFAGVIRGNDRIVVENKLVCLNGHYEMDFEDMERKIKERAVKLFILCSPHNPVGRVWTKGELEKVADICGRHGVIVVSDEIHCDFTYPGHRHTVFASLSGEAAARSILCTSPSKTFNLAGLQAANIFIPNAAVRERFRDAVFRKAGYDELNTLGLTACKAAYQEGGLWLSELREYLRGSLDYVRGFLEERLPEIRLIEPEGTYLLWLDCSGLGLTDEELEDFIVNCAGLWLDAGSMFDKTCGQFERVNITCPRSVLRQAMEQLEGAVAERIRAKERQERG